jgi:peptidyl-prolyl cis-trans isomerase D
LLLTRLQNVVLEGIVVTPDEVEREFRRANEKVKLDYISLNADKFKAQANVTPAEIQAQFNNNRASYQIPEKRSLAIVVIDEPRIAATTTMSDAELQRMYADNRERFRSPERVHVRHILLKTMDKPKEEIPKIQARAEDILKQIKAGADFGELARKHSEDPGSAVKGGDLDWVTRGQMVKPFEETSFSLKPKEISNVIKTDYGFHIVQVLQKEEANLKPFEAVKDQLLSERKRQYVFDRMQLISDQVRAALAKEPQQIDQIAQQHGVPVVRADKVGPGDPLPEIGLSTELDSALAPLNKGQVTPVVQVGPNKLAIAVVTDKIAARPADLNEVEGQIRQSLVERKASELMQKKATEAAGQAKSSGDLKAVAKSLGLEVKTTQPFEQTGAAEGIGPATLVSEAFSKPAGTVIGPIPTGSQTVITRVVEKLPADMAKLSESRGALVEQLKRRKASERKDLFEDGVLSTLTKQGKVKIHEDAIKQLIASYRS